MIKYVSDTFNFDVMIKNLEDKSMLEIFVGFGFSRFQGRLFAPELSLDDVLKFKFALSSPLNVRNFQDDENYNMLCKIVGAKELMIRLINLLKCDEKVSEKLKIEIANQVDNIRTINEKLAEILDTILVKIDKENVINLANEAILLCDNDLNLSGANK